MLTKRSSRVVVNVLGLGKVQVVDLDALRASKSVQLTTGGLGRIRARIHDSESMVVVEAQQPSPRVCVAFACQYVQIVAHFQHRPITGA